MDASSDRVSFVIKPSLLFFLDGFCESDLGLAKVTGHPGVFIVLGTQMPTLAKVTVLPGRSFLLLMLMLDVRLLEGISALQPRSETQATLNYPFLAKGRMDGHLIDILLSLVEQAACPDTDLSPPSLLDLYQYILGTPQGSVLKRLSGLGLKDIHRSIMWLNDRFNHDFSVPDLANIADMPLTSFHRNFKLITGLSPLQYIKTIRLIEARRLMLFYGMNAVNSSKEVGYSSTTQFNREYKRYFIRPPHRDMAYTLRYNAPVYQPLSLTHRYNTNIIT
ncbi:MAG: AraC family transcriptional regulator [Deltaproteobacteria bacterium]|jgi:AraC-like DNA-binding protein|nr:AraC family transcriptional regulator [Deltaproteobacteria bacterium]